MTRLVATLLVLATVLPLGGCYYGPYDGGVRGGGGGRWCYWHPHRCAR